MPFSNALRRHFNGHVLRGMLLLSTANFLMLLAVSLLVWRTDTTTPLNLWTIEAVEKTTLRPPQAPLASNIPLEASNIIPVSRKPAQAIETPSPSTPAPTCYFNGRPLRPVKTQRMRVTAYSPDAKSCGQWADGITASGFSVWTNGGKLVAADTRLLPFGSIITVPGYHGGKPVPVLDRGGRIKGHRLDVLYPTHQQARKWGQQTLAVTFWEYADE